MSAGHVTYGDRLRNRLSDGRILPVVGVYDTFSASLAARRFDAVFLSGYGLAASLYGLPDIGLVSWSHMAEWVENVRFVLPHAHVIVDIDDGYADTNVAINMVKRLERLGASGVMFEDQMRPKKCGHLGGKAVVDLDRYTDNLARLLEARTDLFVVARTDAPDQDEGLKRVARFAELGTDAVLMEGISDISVIPLIRQAVGDSCKIVVNLIHGGRTGSVSGAELKCLGADIIFYSTPCLFAAQEAIATALAQLSDHDRLSEGRGVDLSANSRVLHENLEATAVR